MTLEELQRETLGEKNRRLRQEKCRDEEIYSSIIVTPFKRVGLRLCLDCGKNFASKRNAP
jgi:hypothetical protein